MQYGMAVKNACAVLSELLVLLYFEDRRCSCFLYGIHFPRASNANAKEQSMDSCSRKSNEQEPVPISKDLALTPDHALIKSTLQRSVFHNHHSNSKMTDSSNLTIGVSHVGLSVSDLDASLKFFEALGFKKAGGVESYPSIFVSDGSSLITLWQTDEGATPFDRRKNVGLHHLAIKVRSLEALKEAFNIVSKVAGVRVDGEGAFGPQALDGTPLTHAIVFEPSGNRIELTYHAE
jgi:catechol 2,3-dioxygenase-like lactoylglutathione lyase family enzyme